MPYVTGDNAINLPALFECVYLDAFIWMRLDLFGCKFSEVIPNHRKRTGSDIFTN